jgi:hypothetical protein
MTSLDRRGRTKTKGKANTNKKTNTNVQEVDNDDIERRLLALQSYLNGFHD